MVLLLDAATQYPIAHSSVSLGDTGLMLNVALEGLSQSPFMKALPVAETTSKLPVELKESALGYHMSAMFTL